MTRIGSGSAAWAVAILSLAALAAGCDRLGLPAGVLQASGFQAAEPQAFTVVASVSPSPGDVRAALGDIARFQVTARDEKSAEVSPGALEWSVEPPDLGTIDRALVGNSMLPIDSANQRVREISADGHLKTIAGLGEGRGEPAGLAIGARFRYPTALLARSNDEFFLADTLNDRILRFIRP